MKRIPNKTVVINEARCNKFMAHEKTLIAMKTRMPA